MEIYASLYAELATLVTTEPLDTFYHPGRVEQTHIPTTSIHLLFSLSDFHLTVISWYCPKCILGASSPTLTCKHMFLLDSGASNLKVTVNRNINATCSMDTTHLDCIRN